MCDRNRFDSAAGRPRRRLLAMLAAGGVAALPWPAVAQAEDDPIIETLDIAGSQLEVQFAPGFDAPLRTLALQWVRRSAQVVATYLGRFPVPQAELLLIPADGAGVGSGMSFGEPDPLVRVRVGRRTDADRFHDDWVLVHEMVHLAIPGLPRAQRWLHEGIATYVETIARTRAGLVSEPLLWGGLAHGMPQGQPRDGDRGLDHTPTWGRTYWGGAMFCLLADIEMRRRSHGRAGLQQALQGLLAAGASYAVRWPVERVLAAADASVGQATLSELYTLMKDCPRAVDLEALWRDLGVAPGPDGSATLRDDAPLSTLRHAILA